MILGDLEAEIMVYRPIGFYMAAILKNQDGRHNVSAGSGSYLKWKATVMDSMWGKFGAFVRNVHIHLKYGHKLPD